VLTFQGEEQVNLSFQDNKGGAGNPAGKIHPIIKERVTLFDYGQYENVILAG